MSINGWMNKQNVVYTYNGKLSVTCYNMDKTWRHYAKWNKPVRKKQILYDSTFYEVSKVVKVIETEIKMVVTRTGKERGKDVLFNEYRILD